MKFDGLTIHEALSCSTDHLRRAGCSSPDLDARLLLMGAGDLKRTQLISDAHSVLSPQASTMFAQFLKRRVEREPVHRILGKREFYGREFKLSDSTLIPRPDTEVLIDIALDKLRIGIPDQRVLDLGTGSGNIAVTLAAELPNVTVVGVDLSASALETAKENAFYLTSKQRVTFECGNMFESVGGTFDMIVSNPPYIPTSNLSGLQDEVRLHDPRLALDGGKDGLDFYRTIFNRSSQILNPSGWVCVEIGHDQAMPVCSIAERNGFTQPEVFQDLAGLDRVIATQLGAND